MSQDWQAQEWQTVYGAALRAFATGEVISDGTARTIGSWYADGSDDLSFGFATTGTIPADPSTLWRAMAGDPPVSVAPGKADTRDRIILAALAVYILTHGPRGPVGGWSGVWAA